MESKEVLNFVASGKFSCVLSTQSVGMETCKWTESFGHFVGMIYRIICSGCICFDWKITRQEKYFSFLFFLTLPILKDCFLVIITEYGTVDMHFLKSAVLIRLYCQVIFK